MRRAIGDAALSLVALLILMLVIVSVDDRVREQVAGALSTKPNSSEVAGVSKQINGVVAVVFDAVKDQSVAHAPLVIFGLAATVLVVCMVRT